MVYGFSGVKEADLDRFLHLAPMLRLSGAIPLLPPCTFVTCTGQLYFSLYAVAFNFRLMFLLFWKIDRPVKVRELCNSRISSNCSSRRLGGQSSAVIPMWRRGVLLNQAFVRAVV